jgi:hypothetical protein
MAEASGSVRLLFRLAIRSVRAGGRALRIEPARLRQIPTHRAGRIVGVAFGRDLVAVNERDHVVVDHDAQARDRRVHGGVRRHPGGIRQQFLAPHEPRFHAAADDVLDEAPDDGQPESLAQPGHRGGIRQRLVRAVAQSPTARAIGPRRACAAAVRSGCPPGPSPDSA